MRRVGTLFGFILLVVLGVLVGQGTVYASGSASILALYPAAEVPIGAHVSFTVGTSGFTNPTFYLVDSFPGGVTTSYLDSSGNFSWTPNTSEIGSHGLTITVSDSLGDSATASQTITVDGTPTVTIGSPTPAGTVSIGTPVSFSVSSGGLLNPSYTLVDAFFSSTVQRYDLNASNTFTWTPIAQDIGAHSITVTGKDIYGNSASATTVIIVLPTPTAAITGLFSTNVAVGQAVAFNATSTGFINPTYAISDSFSSGLGTSTLGINSSGKVTWTPQYNDIGVHLIKIVVSDSSTRSVTANVSLTVSAAATAPTQAVTPAAPTAPAVTPPPVIVPPPSPAKTNSTKNTQTPTAPTASNIDAQSAFTQTQTPAEFTDGSAASNPESTSSTSTEVVIPITAPVESIGGFFIDSVVNFFASIFHIF